MDGWKVLTEILKAWMATELYPSTFQFTPVYTGCPYCGREYCSH